MHLQAVKLLMRCQLSLLITAVPVVMTGGGNCLFQAFSQALYDYEDVHDMHVHLLAATETRHTHPATHDSNSAT